MLSHNDVNFIIERKENVINFTVKFDDKKCTQFSSKKIDHFSNYDYANYLTDALSSGGCTDIQPINGVYQKKFIKNLFKTKTINDVSNQLNYLKDHEENKYVKVFVLDIKDSKCSYNILKDIQLAEKEVKDFFSGKEPKEKSPRRDMYKLIKENNINYFFCEGHLKNFLISEVFSDEESNFFQKTDQGKAILCQISEILLNEFKLGYEIIVSSQNKTHTLSPGDYLILLKNKSNIDFNENMITITPITLFTLYPSHYKELYGIREKYCDSLSNCLKVEHDYDERTQTTAIRVQL